MNNLFSPTDIAKLTNKSAEATSLRSFSSGIEPIDTNFKGFMAGRVVGIQAPTSHAKSTIMLSMAETMARQCGDGEVVLYATWEDSVEMMAYKMASRATMVPLHNIYAGKLTDEDKAALQKAATKIQSNRLWIVGHSEASANFERPTVSTLFEAVQYLKTEYNVTVQVIFVDYLQRISFADIDHGFRGNTERFTELVNRLKDLAIHTRAMLVVGTQVSRDIIKNAATKKNPTWDDFMPDVGDSQWTSNFEQTCDVIFSQFVPRKVMENGIPLLSGIFVTPDLLLMEIQKDKLGETEIVLPLSVDWKTGNIDRWTPERAERLARYS